MKLLNAFRIELLVLTLITLYLRFWGNNLLVSSISIGAVLIIFNAVIAILFLSLVLGRIEGITNGIGGALMLCGLNWLIMSSLGGYEVMFLPPWFFDTIPLVLMIGGAVYLVIDLFLKRKVVTPVKLSKVTWYLVVISLVAAVAIWLLMHAARWTLGYVDQGIPIDYLSKTNLDLTLSAVIIFGISISMLVINLIQKYGIVSLLFSILGVISTLLVGGVYFFFLIGYWFGINAILLSLVIISFVGSLPLRKKM